MPQSFVYIITNRYRTVLYIGVTNDLSRRLDEHRRNISLGAGSFAARYRVYLLIYSEVFFDIRVAIDRETQLKKWNRAKK